MAVSDAASRWAGWALAHLEFGRSVNPVPTRGADYAHHIIACPPGFENLTASLAVINPPERKLTNRTSVHCFDLDLNDQKTRRYF
jgi:hypothetical protein